LIGDRGGNIREIKKKCFLCGGELTAERSHTVLIVFMTCKKCGVISDYYLIPREDDMKQLQTNDLDLTVEMWVQVKITLAFKLAAELQKQIDEITEILTTNKHKKRWVRF